MYDLREALFRLQVLTNKLEQCNMSRGSTRRRSRARVGSSRIASNVSIVQRFKHLIDADITMIQNVLSELKQFMHKDADAMVHSNEDADKFRLYQALKKYVLQNTFSYEYDEEEDQVRLSVKKGDSYQDVETYVRAGDGNMYMFLIDRRTNDKLYYGDPIPFVIIYILLLEMKRVNRQPTYISLNNYKAGLCQHYITYLAMYPNKSWRECFEYYKMMAWIDYANDFYKEHPEIDNELLCKDIKFWTYQGDRLIRQTYAKIHEKKSGFLRRSKDFALERAREVYNNDTISVSNLTEIALQVSARFSNVSKLYRPVYSGFLHLVRVISLPKSLNIEHVDLMLHLPTSWTVVTNLESSIQHFGQNRHINNVYILELYIKDNDMISVMPVPDNCASFKDEFEVIVMPLRGRLDITRIKYIGSDEVDDEVLATVDPDIDGATIVTVQLIRGVPKRKHDDYEYASVKRNR